MHAVRSQPKKKVRHREKQQDATASEIEEVTPDDDDKAPASYGGVSASDDAIPVPDGAFPIPGDETPAPGEDTPPPVDGALAVVDDLPYSKSCIAYCCGLSWISTR